MTREEKIKRIEVIKQTMFDIQIGSDFLTHQEHEYIRQLNAEKRKLEEKLKED